MTPQEFNQAVRQKGSISHSVGIMGSSVILILGLIATGMAGTYGLLIVAFGAIGLYRTFIEFKIIKFTSSKDLQQKINLIKKYTHEVNANSPSITSNFINFIYTSELLSRVEVMVLCEKDGYQINIRQLYTGKRKILPSLVVTNATNKLVQFLNETDPTILQTK